MVLSCIKGATSHFVWMFVKHGARFTSSSPPLPPQLREFLRHVEIVLPSRRKEGALDIRAADALTADIVTPFQGFVRRVRFSQGVALGWLAAGPLALSGAHGEARGVGILRPGKGEAGGRAGEGRRGVHRTRRGGNGAAMGILPLPRAEKTGNPDGYGLTRQKPQIFGFRSGKTHF